MKYYLILLLLFNNFLLSATSYYVKNDGNDSNSGLADADAWAHHPWMIGWTGNVILNPGDTVFMKRNNIWIITNPTGSYMNVKQSGKEGKQIVTTAYGTGNKPLIQISTNSNFPVIQGSDHSFISFDNLDIKHYSPKWNATNNQNGIQFGGYGTSIPHDWIITNCDIHDCPRYGIGQYGSSYNITIGDPTANTTATANSFSNYIYDCGYGGINIGGKDPITLVSNHKVYYNYIKNIGVSATDLDNVYGTTFGSKPNYGYFCYNRIENIPNWHGYDHHNGSNIWITDNYFLNVRGAINTNATNEGGTPPAICDHIYIERNIIEFNSDHPTSYYYAIYVNSTVDSYPCTNILIKDNKIFYTNRPSGSSSLMIKIFSVDGIIIEGNHIYNGPTTNCNGAIYICNGSTYHTKNVILRNNYIANWSPSIYFYKFDAELSASIYNNIIYTENALAIQATQTATLNGFINIYDNVILSKPVSGSLVTFNNSTISAGSSINIKNNIFGFTSTANLGRYIIAPNVITGKFETDYNLYWNCTREDPFYYLGTYNWSNWNKLGYDIHSLNNTDPLFKNITKNYSQDSDFDIQGSSPVINKGVSVGLTYDYRGSLVSGIPDIGAFEYANVPVYISSVIENETPSKLDINYDLILANSVPASSAFYVKVNSVSRQVNSVSLSGSKVSLMLSGPVAYGDIVTVTYIKPPTNPIQTVSGGQASGMTDQSVTNNCTAVIPVYLNSVVQNNSPGNIEVTFNRSLANIVPPVSAFAVLVNSVSRTVSSVEIVSGKVRLTLASPISYGNTVTIAYTKPGTNPLQTPDGGQAESFSAKNVTNNCTPEIPVFVSAVIENSTPSILEMSYDINLVNLIPPVSAFNVQVNSTARTISSVAIVSGKVRLTLSSPVIYGDIITVSYTKPSSNALQTSDGGQAESLTSATVKNNCTPKIPVFISATIETATPSIIEMTYDMSLANVVPAVSAFSVVVNSTLRSINSVAIVSGKVRLTISSPCVYGDNITVSYTKPATNPLQTSTGQQADNLNPQPVTNNIGAKAPVFLSAVVENSTPSIIDMLYDLNLANIVPPVSAFTILVNSVSRIISSVEIVSGKVRLTLSSPINYGNVVTIAYAKPSTNPLQTPDGGLAESFAAKTVTNNCSPEIPVFVSAVIENSTPSILEMSYDINLVNLIPPISAFNVQVNSSVRTISSIAIVSGKVRLTLSSPVIYGDIITVSYTKPSSNALQTSDGGQAENLTSATVKNNCTPKIPVFISAIIETATPSIIEMTYDLSLANVVPPVSAFSVLVNSIARSVNSVAIVSGKVRITISSPCVYGDNITASYTKPATNPLQTSTGQQAENLSLQPVTNNIGAKVPVFLNAVVENATPGVIEMKYDLDLVTIIPPVSAFQVTVNSVSRVVISAAIVSGKVRLNLASDIKYGEVITVAYTKPVLNPLQTASGGQASDLSPQPVINNCVDPSLPNNLPAAVLNYNTSYPSGFVYELDASGSYDLDYYDTLRYSWTIPSTVPVSSITGPKIKFLAPVVTSPSLIECRLDISDGKEVTSKNFSLNINPFKPALSLAKMKTIEASYYNLSDYPDNVADGNLQTKWSAEGENQWLVFSFAEPFRINHLQIAFLSDQKYESYFDIYVSKDNVFWDEVYVKKASCNFSGAPQNFIFPLNLSNNDYSYLKLIGQGSSLDSWNNYSEIRIIGSKGVNPDNPSFSSNNISIYPNPASEAINVLILEPSSIPQQLKIFNYSGLLCFETQIMPGVNHVQIPLNLKSGNYVAQVLLKNIIVFTHKLTIID